MVETYRNEQMEGFASAPLWTTPRKEAFAPSSRFPLHINEAPNHDSRICPEFAENNAGWHCLHNKMISRLMHLYLLRLQAHHPWMLALLIGFSLTGQGPRNKANILQKR
jgi:hypothetical protein